MHQHHGKHKTADHTVKVTFLKVTFLKVTYLQGVCDAM